MSKARQLADVNQASQTIAGTKTFSSNPIVPTATADNQVINKGQVDTIVASVVNSAPSTLDTLNELATALGNDANFATTIAASIATKAPLASPTFTGTVTAPTFSGALTGNATTATALQTTRNIALTGVVTGNANFDGSANISIATTLVSAGIPSGGIILWSGSTASIPAGWYLCNGANGTPNLQDRFVVGAGSGYAVGATGGATTASVGGTTGATTLTTAQMPSHNHNSRYGADYYNSEGCSNIQFSSSSYCITDGGTSSTGGGGSHTHSMAGTVDTRSLYYALAYIMKS